jgi:hypothetical protein
MQQAKVRIWLSVLLLALASCIGQDSWSRWVNAHPHPELAPMHRIHLVVEDGWQSVGSVQSDDYRGAIVTALTERGIAIEDDRDSSEATVLVRPWHQRARGGGRGGSSGYSSSGVEVRIDRKADGQRIFSGRFAGGPAASGNAIADLVAHGRVDAT